jgi:hypothetical protein
MTVQLFEVVFRKRTWDPDWDGDFVSERVVACARFKARSAAEAHRVACDISSDVSCTSQDTYRVGPNGQRERNSLSDLASIARRRRFSR